MRFDDTAGTEAGCIRFDDTTTNHLQFSHDCATSWTAFAAASITADSLDFTEFTDTMALDASTSITADNAEVLSFVNTGTGNSFVVEDAASDTTPFVIDPSGNVGVGVTAPQSALHIPDGGYLQAKNNNGAPPAGDCDNDAERGRLSIDPSNNRLYVCNGATRG